MKKNVKKFWNKHKNIIKTVITIAIIPVPAIVLYAVCSKFIDKHSEELGDLYENGYGEK